MGSLSVTAQIRRWVLQLVITNEVDENGDEFPDETDELTESDITPHVGVVSATLAADDRPYFGFSPSHPDQQPWWDEEEEHDGDE